MEIIIDLFKPKRKIKAAVFDFDGTLSTLRHGWEGIMEPLMLEMIAGPTPIDEKLIKEVRTYINVSTGLQTIHQMQWLLDTVKKYGRNPKVPYNPWDYKAEYNRRLMKPIEERIDNIKRGEKTREDYLIKGSEDFLKQLKRQAVELYVASGTDHCDVIRETEIVGLKDYFKDISGAPYGKIQCSKEAVLRKLIAEKQLEGHELLVIGDGKVEIALGRESGAITLGMASDEDKLCGVNQVKRERLIKAGAHAIIGDYLRSDEILNWLRF